MRRLLLIQPYQHDGLIGFGQTLKIPGLGQRAGIAPLSLATVAALTPEKYAVGCWDETTAGEITEETPLEHYDLVGVTGYNSHLVRVKRLGNLFKRRGIPVVLGGPGVSAAPEKYRDAFDVVFVGEAEHTWPQFLADWEAGRQRDEYRQVTRPDLAASPMPNWDPIDVNRYLVGAVQSTRGCPFDCSFCDVIYLYGRQARHKPIDRILGEVADLERRGVRAIFLCDDNLYGHPKYAKDLLRQLIPLNRSFESPINFITQITMNAAQDDEMLALLADAHFTRLFVGVETPNKESLKEANKPQNYRTDIVESIRRIQSHGMVIRAGMIVGFDHDGPGIFDEQADFVKETHLLSAMTGILQAPIGTPLWTRLYKEGRVIEADPERFAGPGQRAFTNITPASMTREELYRGFSRLLGKIYAWDHFAERVIGFVSGVTRKPQVERRRSLRWRELRAVLGALRFLLFELRGDERRHALRILRHTRRTAPYLMELVAGVIFVFHHERSLLAPQLAAIRRQIELEKGLTLTIARGDEFVPLAFKKPYKEVFPAVYRRVAEGLLDRSRLEAALVEVFGDFLVRWGQSFTQFEDYHQSYLMEICDRTLAKENSHLARPALAGGGLAVMPDFRATRLPEQVLRSVEQDLRVGGRARLNEAPAT